ncbi:uncharacterized protein LOC111116888 [Crassostrea virginica]
MEFINGIIFLTVLVLAIAYDDLSRNKFATQSTTYPHGRNDPNTYVAGNAVDRNITTCMMTIDIGLGSSEKTVWWRVDLGGVYNIYSVNVLFRSYESYKEIRQRGRLAGFSLYVSNTSTMDSSSLCYKDGPKLPSLNFTTNCLTFGRYVTFYNERLTGASYPQGYQQTVYTEICEVLVQGCKTSGTYGSSCEERCSPNCRDDVCHIQRGTCFGCKPGWTGRTCNTRCIQSYGENCQVPCSKHCVNHTCNGFHGICQFGCESGYHGQNCEEEFPSTLLSGFMEHQSAHACLQLLLL